MVPKTAADVMSTKSTPWVGVRLLALVAVVWSSAMV
jgi:hypothetical protein